MSERARWYVVHTYSGYENKVKANIEKTVENRNLESLIHDIQVPMEEVIEEKDGKQKVSLKKKFPGYVLIKMLMTDESWYVVRNTRGVTGFVGPGSKPVPLTEEEMRPLGIDLAAERAKAAAVEIDFEEGDTIEVVSGAWQGTVGQIKAINLQKQTVFIDIDIFGRATSVEINFMDVKKM